jgi:hypothetical protein
MHFIAGDEARLLEKQLRRQIADKPKPKLILYHNSGCADYSAATRAMTAAIGEFIEASLHFLFCVSGDGWSEGNEMNEQWRGYRQWRGARGQHRRITDAPVHVFVHDEAEQLCKALELALQLGWDALLSAKPGDNCSCSRTMIASRSTAVLTGARSPKDCSYSATGTGKGADVRLAS